MCVKDYSLLVRTTADVSLQLEITRFSTCADDKLALSNNSKLEKKLIRVR